MALGDQLAVPGAAVLREALALAAAGQADALVVSKLDRLSRSLVRPADLVAWSQRNRLALVALDLGLHTSTDTGLGRLVARIMVSVGEWERERISDRTRAAAAVRRSEGRRMGRAGVRDTAPEVAARIRAEREAGQTWQAIADGLNRDGYPRCRGAPRGTTTSSPPRLRGCPPRSARKPGAASDPLSD